MRRLKTASEVGSAFGEDDLALWVTDLVENSPPTPTIAECMAAADAKGFSGVGRRLGVVLRLTSGDGEVRTVSLNPVIAARIAEAIRDAGLRHGWLGDDGQVTFPPGDPT